MKLSDIRNRPPESKAELLAKLRAKLLEEEKQIVNDDPDTRQAESKEPLRTWQKKLSKVIAEKKIFTAFKEEKCDETENFSGAIFYKKENCAVSIRCLFGRYTVTLSNEENGATNCWIEVAGLNDQTIVTGLEKLVDFVTVCFPKGVK